MKKLKKIKSFMKKPKFESKKSKKPKNVIEINFYL